MEDVLVCECGWQGTVEQQDALGSKRGCCPDCGNEDLVWLQASRIVDKIIWCLVSMFIGILLGIGLSVYALS